MVMAEGVTAGGHVGMVATRCQCWHENRRRAFYDAVPKEFLGSRLDTAQPDPGRHPRQSEMLATIRSDPEASYIFVGQNGSGKSFASWLLVMNCFESGRRTVVVDLDGLLKQYRLYEFNEGANPAVLADDLKPFPSGQKRDPITIFIDEIAATTPTEYAAKEFFHLLKAAHEFGHQVLMTCNVTLDELHRHWGSRCDSALSNSIMRRITDYMTLIDLTK
jgi:DNA replication protein DnaC